MTAQPSLFDGETYDPALDEDRLASLLGRVWAAMAKGGWWTLTRLRDQCGGSEASVSARIRDLRKRRFGSHFVERRRVVGGLWEYRLLR